MDVRSRCLGALLVICTLLAAAQAEPIAITSGTFILARPLVGTEASVASLVWFNPPAGAFGSAMPDLVQQVWQPSEYSSTLLGTNAPVQPLHPGPAPVGGTFTASNVSLQFTGGMFQVPSVFPPTDEEGLYTLTRPFSMTGHWTIAVPLDGGTALFDGDIVGSGRARLVLGADRVTGNSIISQVIYDFQGGAPIPEPATLLLWGAGAAGVFVRGKIARRSRERRV